MISEFHARYSLFLKPDHVQMEAIDFLTGKEKQPPKSWQELGEVTDPSARLSLLTQAVITAYKDYSRVGRRRDAGLLEALGRLEKHYIKQYDDFMSPLCLNPVIPDISMFPEGSWALSFKFRLKKPYISKDDTDFYIIDNPIRKEWVFKLPYIAASQWKGALRAAMVKQLVEISDDDEFAKRRFYQTLLFGDEKGEVFGEKKESLAGYLDRVKSDKAAKHYQEKVCKIFQCKKSESLPSHSGDLYFYPTYFDKIGIEVINPHDRETGAGEQPIYFESVPSGAKGEFLLLYVPLHGSGIEYLFSWEEIPGNDNVRLIEFLMQNFSIEWVKAAKIKKNDDGKTIRVNSEENFLSLTLNDEKTNINLEIDDGRTDKFIVKIKNGKLNIYKKEDQTHYLKFVVEGIKAMMTQYGFGAKTSSGFGVAENNIEHGGLLFNKRGIDTPINNKEPEHNIPEEYAKYLKEDGTVKEELCASDGKLLNIDQFFNSVLKGEMSQKKFRNFRRWYNDYIEKKKSIQYKGFADDLCKVEFIDFDQLLKQVDVLLQDMKRSEGSNCQKI